MKILEAQSAILTNYEVYEHILNQRARYTARRRMGPGNLETLMKEILSDLRAPPSPLGNNPIPYNSNTIRTLIVRLRTYDLAKAEMLMIMNHRPTHISHLMFILEDLEERFPEPATQQEIIDVIAEVLGAPDGEAERVAMSESAKGARERQMEAEAREAQEAQGVKEAQRVQKAHEMEIDTPS